MDLDLDIPADEDEPYDPGEDEPYSPASDVGGSTTPPLLPGAGLKPAVPGTEIAKTLEELNRKIADREKEIQSIASTVFSSVEDKVSSSS